MAKKHNNKPQGVSCAAEDAARDAEGAARELESVACGLKRKAEMAQEDAEAARNAADDLKAAACMTKRFNFHTDPGHGWLQVSFDDLSLVNLAPESFSQCSYKSNSSVYLEEDCDAGKFLAAWTAAYGKPSFREVASNNESFIRNLSLIY